MLFWLAPLFSLTALIYASVGFAGGSTYTALLVLAGIDAHILVVLSLACNIVVATGGVIRFAAAQAIAWRRTFPLLLLSVPLAWFGGQISIDKRLFILLLGGSLLVAGLLLLLGPDRQTGHQKSGKRQADGARTGWAAILAAAPIGLLSGIVGIGGGIFLAPLLHLMRWDSGRRIAGTASLFILVNSIAGLLGQRGTLQLTDIGGIVTDWWPLIAAVLVGGQLGSFLGAKHLPVTLVRRITGIVVLFAAVRLLLSL